jgi:acyl carrier protein
MQLSAQTLVHELLAFRLRIHRAAISNDDSFRPLGIDSFDLVLVVLRIEDSAPTRGDFPFDLLERATTVGDLVALTERWLRVDAPSRPTAYKRKRRGNRRATGGSQSSLNDLGPSRASRARPRGRTRENANEYPVSGKNVHDMRAVPVVRESASLLAGRDRSSGLPWTPDRGSIAGHAATASPTPPRAPNTLALAGGWGAGGATTTPDGSAWVDLVTQWGGRRALGE